LNNKNSAIFLATVLVAGIIGISSPFTAFAQGYNGYEYEEKEYNNYDQSKPDRKYDKFKPVYQHVNCENHNKINIGVNQDQTQQTENTAGGEANLNSQQLTPEETWKTLDGNSNGNKEPSLNTERNILEFCIDNTDGDFTTHFSGGAQIDNDVNQNRQLSPATETNNDVNVNEQVDFDIPSGIQMD
jgi:hypothetical protein